MNCISVQYLEVAAVFLLITLFILQPLGFQLLASHTKQTKSDPCVWSRFMKETLMS